jgi:hypothetical protein
MTIEELKKELDECKDIIKEYELVVEEQKERIANLEGVIGEAIYNFNRIL